MTKTVKMTPAFEANVGDKMPYVDISDLVQVADGAIFFDAEAVEKRYWSVVNDTVGIDIVMVSGGRE